jgi:SAM-dependent methyltransferase
MDSLLRCPCQNKSTLKDCCGVGMICEDKLCSHSLKEHAFPLLNGIPVLIAPDLCDTVCEVHFGKNSPSIEYVKRGSGFLREKIATFLSFSAHKTMSNCKKFLAELRHSQTNPKVLIIGSGTHGAGADLLWSDSNVIRVGVDIYPSESVNYIADAHYLPFANSSFDGVWIQAVLEHVVDPENVVTEIHRVMKSDGVIYSEIPFMQYVHEGAYDFTRYTILGHRYLFKNFGLVSFGPIGNAADTLNWAFKGYVYGVTRSKFIAKIFSLPFLLALKLFSSLVSKESQWENSTGSFFLGKKTSSTLTHRDLIKLYKKTQNED